MQSAGCKSLAKYDEMHKYNVSVIEVFSEFLHLIPVKTEWPFRRLGVSVHFHDDDSRGRPNV